MAKYPHCEDGWFPVYKRGFRLKCCSCGLVHTIDFKHKDDTLFLKIDRHEGATKAARRAIRKTVVIVDE